MTASKQSRATQRVGCKRVYAPPQLSDGMRVLVDRLWPRGLSKDAARVDLWLKDVAPSDGLRRWFDHDRDRWTEFRRRYRAELRANAALAVLREMLMRGAVTLVFAARDEAHNNAVVLAEVLFGTTGPSRH
jgi:uncharacterized protein YeaO (DUF488 family)